MEERRKGWREGQWEHSGKHEGVLMKHGVRDVCACVRVSILRVHVHLCVLRPGRGLLDGSEGPGLGGTRLAQWQPIFGSCPPLTIQSQQHSHGGACQETCNAPTPPPQPPGTPLLRNEVIIEVDTVYAVRGGDAAEGTAGGTKEPGAGRKNFPFSSFDEKEQKK